MATSTFRLLVSAACLLLVHAAKAQAPLPLPASHAASEGTTSTNIPFGRSVPTRVQYVYDAMLFAGPVTITAVQFRPDGGFGVAAKTVDCELRMSTMPHPLVGLDVAFAQNRGADETVVLSRQLRNLPLQPAGGTPSAFLPPLTLTTPFAYDPQNGALVLEIIVYGQPPGAWSLDATYVCNSPEVLVGPQSCSQSNGALLQVESATTQVMWGRPWVARVTGGAPGQLLLLALGTRETGTWAGMSLPQNLAVAGAPGCYVSIDAAVLDFAPAASDGSAAFPFVIPNDPRVLGLWLRFQGATFDAAANALGLVTSQARKVQVCGWEPVGRVWSSGITASFGTREMGVAAVLQLTVQ